MKKSNFVIILMTIILGCVVLLSTSCSMDVRIKSPMIVTQISKSAQVNKSCYYVNNGDGFVCYFIDDDYKYKINDTVNIKR